MEDRDDWLLLHRVPGIGVVTFNRLLDAFGSPGRALRASSRELAELGVPAESRHHLADPDQGSIDSDRRWLEAPDRHLITVADARYPPRLREIADPPPLLFVCGHPGWLSAAQVAIIGSRNPSRGGADTAFAFASALAERGLVVTSGLARGIDAQSHRGALEAGGASLAVMGTGPDVIYPRAHESLGAAIAARGAFISEFPTATPVRPENFPRRNRIISGLSFGVLVVEAARTSGSLITARHALGQGRDVFAIPGSIHNPLARGCHALIKQGAKLVECVDDILEELPAGTRVYTRTDVTREGQVPSPPPAQGAEYRRLFDALGYDAVSVDSIVSRTGLTANAVSSMLLLLELQGQVSSQAGGLYARVRSGDS
ncbi:MAG: DNA-processing protein DprA [Chromatiales bacterium]